MRTWKKVKEFDGYEVSSDGLIRSYINNRHGIGTKCKLLKPTCNSRGYQSVCFGRGNRRSVHRVVAEAFIENNENYPLVRHLDDNPANNCVENLAWGTQTDNMQDCVRHGRLVGDTRSAIEARKKRILALTIYDTPIAEFNSYTEAGKYLHIDPTHIKDVLTGKISQTHGYHFRSLGKEECYDYYYGLPYDSEHEEYAY